MLFVPKGWARHPGLGIGPFSRMEGEEDLPSGASLPVRPQSSCPSPELAPGGGEGRPLLSWDLSLLDLWSANSLLTF